MLINYYMLYKDPVKNYEASENMVKKLLNVPQIRIYQAGTGMAITAKNVDKLFQQIPFRQETPTTVWTINHGKNKFPIPIMFDDSGKEIFGVIRHVDTNSLTITFPEPTAGTAYID